MQNKKKEIEAYPKSKGKTMHFKEEGKNVKQLNNNNNNKKYLKQLLDQALQWQKKLVENSIQVINWGKVLKKSH